MSRRQHLLVRLLPEARRSLTALAVALLLVLPLVMLSPGWTDGDLVMVAPALYLLAAVLWLPTRSDTGPLPA